MNCSRVLIGGAFIGFLGAQAQAVPAQDDSRGPVLFYRQPAKEWVEALPIGNGRLGGMVFGGVPAERIQLNEDTFWSGGPYDAIRRADRPARDTGGRGDHAGREVADALTPPRRVLPLPFSASGPPQSAKASGGRCVQGRNRARRNSARVRAAGLS
jgi:alpha-L-fucosidase 2